MASVSGLREECESAPLTVPTSLTRPAAPRVAYLPDSFHEVNGVAHTSRHFEAFARRRRLPFLCIRAGESTQSCSEEGGVQTLDLTRSFLSFALEKDLRYDPAFLRHLPRIACTLKGFQPDLIHITGPSELGMLGAWMAHRLGVPLAASWHTNVHEYAARRSGWLLRLLPQSRYVAAEQKIEDWTMAVAAKFYSTADVLFAPNPELCALLERSTGKICHRMPRAWMRSFFILPSASAMPMPGIGACAWQDEKSASTPRGIRWQIFPVDRSSSAHNSGLGAKSTSAVE